jgi:hypothetical protein
VKISEIQKELLCLRDIIHEEVDVSSVNDSYYFYVIYSYLFLLELKLQPALVRGAGKTWVELTSKKGTIYVVDLNFNDIIIQKENTYLCNVDLQEIGLNDFVSKWPEKISLIKTKRWPKMMKPHSTFESPPSMSQKPKKPKRPPQHAPKMRRHKII